MELSFPMILDGATGTQLQKYGCGSGECSEAWVLEHPEAILKIQRDYVRAGSRVLYTPTFGANRVKLEARGLGDKVREYNLRLAALCREAAGGKALVAGDMAPTGRFLRPLGDMRFEDLVGVYTEQAAALEEAGVDLFVIETMMTVAEARAALLAVRSVSRKPVFVSFTCSAQGRTMMGTDVCAALQILQGMGADAFGLNCSTGPQEMAPLFRRLREIARIPLLAKPNAGAPEIVNGETVYACPPEVFTAQLSDMAENGVMIFGGCCGTGAEHIAALQAGTAGLRMRLPMPDAARLSLLPCATEKDVFFLEPDAEIGEVLACDAELEDALYDAMEDECEAVAVRIEQTDDLPYFADNQYLIAKPLCLICDDASLLEQALRLYQGRALYRGGLSPEALSPLVQKYGLIRLQTAAD